MKVFCLVSQALSQILAVELTNFPQRINATGTYTPYLNPFISFLKVWKLKISKHPSLGDSIDTVNGEADKHAYPWQVAIYCKVDSECYNNLKMRPWEGYRGPLCGGTIICPKFIVTAAHCIGTFKGKGQDTLLQANDLHVLVGEHRTHLKEGKHNFPIYDRLVVLT